MKQLIMSVLVSLPLLLSAAESSTKSSSAKSEHCACKDCKCDKCDCKDKKSCDHGTDGKACDSKK